MYNKYLMAVLVVMLSACSSINVVKKGGTATDLSNFSSYRWTLPAFSDPDNIPARLVQSDRSMRNAVAEQMSKRGFTEASAPTDLIIDYRVVQSAEFFSETPPVDYQDYGWIWTQDDAGKVERHKNKPNVDPNARVPKAVLTLTIYSSDKSTILWQMEADKLIEKQGDLEQLDRGLYEAVKKMYQHFPMGQ